MVKAAFAVLLALALPVMAAPGFFRPQRHVEDRAIAPTKDAASSPCSLQVAFNPLEPAIVEVQMGGANAPACLSTIKSATFSAAANYIKAMVGGEPGNDVYYLCSFSLAWNSAAPAAPTITGPTLPDGISMACDPYRPQAIVATYNLILVTFP